MIGAATWIVRDHQPGIGTQGGSFARRRSQRYELAPHCLKFGGRSIEDLRCRVKSNVVTAPGPLNGRGNQHNPGASRSDECFEMSFIVLALNHSCAEELMKQRCGSGGVCYYEGYVAKRFEHGSTSSGHVRRTK